MMYEVFKVAQISSVDDCFVTTLQKNMKEEKSINHNIIILLI